MGGRQILPEVIVLSDPEFEERFVQLSSLLYLNEALFQLRTVIREEGWSAEMELHSVGVEQEVNPSVSIIWNDFGYRRWIEISPCGQNKEIDEGEAKKGESIIACLYHRIESNSLLSELHYY